MSVAPGRLWALPRQRVLQAASSRYLNQVLDPNTGDGVSAAMPEPTLFTNIYKALHAARRRRRTAHGACPLFGLTGQNDGGPGPRRALWVRSGQRSEVGNEGHELERLDDVEGAVCIVAQHVDGAAAVLGEERAPCA